MLLAVLIACAGFDWSGPSVCEGSDRAVSCPFETTRLADRDVHWQVPLPEADRGEVALLFQGALFPAELFWQAPRGTPLGGFHQARLTKALLDTGFTVVTPEALGAGLTCWTTNLPGDWEESADAWLMDELWAALDAGDFGPADAVYAGGISSGGYMTSRLAVTWPERLDAVAISSASYATCAGVLCEVPDALPELHPPTLFLHGALDAVVPIWTMEAYRDGVRAIAGEDVAVSEVDALGGHGWSREAPEIVLAWWE